MDGVAGDAQGHGFVVAAVEDIELGTGEHMEPFEELQKAFVLFVDAEDFRGIVGAQLRKENAALPAELRDTAIYRHPMRASLVTGEALDQQRFDFGRDGVFHALGFGMRFGPGQANHFGEENLGELVTNHQPMSETASFGGEDDATTAAHFDVSVASHALESGGHRRRSDVEFFREPGADGFLTLLEHLPNGFEVIFLRNAGFFAAQRISDRLGSSFLLLSTQPGGQQQNPGFDLFENSLISGRVFAIGIFDIPLFDLRVRFRREVIETVERRARKIDDEVRVPESFRGEGFGLQMVNRVAIGQKRLLGEWSDAA